MYNYSIKLTYLKLDDKKQDTQFRKELLDVFGVPEYRHKTFMTTIDNIYNKYKNNKQVENILNEVKTNCYFPFELDQDTFIRKIEFVPDNKQIVHHVNAHLITYEDGQKNNIFNVHLKY